jgi:hypothetical protein
MKLPYKNNKEVVFKKMKPKQSFKLRNQESELTDFSESDVEYYLEDMYITPDQFVVLSAPEAQHKVRFVQACTHDREIEVEIGIEEEGTRLFYKMCSQEECCRIFLDFYDNVFIPKMEEYKPVEF